MNSDVTKVAVVGSGISGAVCASTLARNGVPVTLFESARGPGGRMSQRRENTEDGKELLFHHGAPFFSVSKSEVLSLVHEWESRGLIAEWKEKFGSFDFCTRKFTDIEQAVFYLFQWSLLPLFIIETKNRRVPSAEWPLSITEGLSKRYVGVPGMNSICKELCNENGVESKFGVSIGKIKWSDDEHLWSLMGLDGQILGQFKGIVASDKNIVSPRFQECRGGCHLLTIIFCETNSIYGLKGFSIKNSNILRWAHCESSKPGRSTNGERWVLHSTAEYAENIIAQTGLKKPSDTTLKKVADELFQEFQSTGLNKSQPFFMKAHRWGSAFPGASIAPVERCVWYRNKRLDICGYFCVSPNVDGAVDSRLAAASKLLECLELFIVAEASVCHVIEFFYNLVLVQTSEYLHLSVFFTGKIHGLNFSNFCC